MTDFNEAFLPIYELTLALQAEQLAMSDVVVLWYKCRRDLKKLDTETNGFVVPLIEAFVRRSETIMENPLLATAAYVDPRLNHKKRSPEFLGEMTEVAEKLIFLVVQRIIELGATNNMSATTRTVDDDEDDIDQFIELYTSRNATTTATRSADDKYMFERIRELGNQDKLKMKSNIFGYYEQKKKQRAIDSILFDAVMVVLSAPATQVSVERAFSALALLMDDVRCKLSSLSINKILTVALNSELTNQVDFST